MTKGADEVLEYLDKLLRDEDWNGAQRYAQKLLHDDNLVEADVAKVHFALAQARFSLGDFEGSAVACNIVLSISERLEMWELFGHACLNLSAAYHRMGEITKAEAMIHRLLERAELSVRQAPFLEVHAWFNLGTMCFISGRLEDAARCFRLSSDVASRLGLTRHAHGSRQALIQAYLGLGLVKSVPRLLAKCAHYLRHTDTTTPQYRQSVLFHYLLRVKYAIETKKVLRARVFALRALDMAEGAPLHQFDFHMQLARLAQSVGSTIEAAGHSLAAHVFAAQSRQHDLQAEAAKFLYDLSVDRPDILLLVDRFYAGV